MKNNPKSKRVRPLGQITTEFEPFILEMAVDHDMQWGEILNIVYGYLRIHCPGAQEQYTAGGNPEFYYGPERACSGKTKKKSSGKKST